MIGRITTDGALTEFPVPMPNSDPDGIAAGPNALWFTEYLTGRIGRITIEGTIHDAGAPAPNSYPAGFAVRPSGGVWFTESGGNNIGALRSG